jgi:cobalt-zinc-cadmium efflux system protein
MHKHDATTNIKIAFLLNFIFTIAEIIGGFFTNSLAIISDGLHDLGDAFSLGLSWYLAKLSSKEKTPKFSYGYKRFSLLAALINSIILLAGSLFILTKAIPRLINPEHSNAKGMLIFAIVGLAVNGFAAWKVHKGKSMNEQVITWHLLEDVLGWAAVLIVSVVLLIRDIPILDPLLSILITLYILWNVVKKLKESLMIFLQSVPKSVEVKKLEQEIVSLDSIQGIHDTHLWSLDGASHILSTHIIVSKDARPEDVFNAKCGAKKIAQNFGIEHATIEVEAEGESCETKSS